MNKSVNISLTPAVTNSFAEDVWVRLELVPSASDIATTEDIANLIDELYGTSICDDEYELPVCGGEPLPVKEEDDPNEATAIDPSQQELAETIKEELGIVSCEAANDFFTAEVNVVTSNPIIPYKLVVENGEIISTTIIEERVTLRFDIKKSSYVKTTYPIVSDLQVRFVGGVVNHDGEGTPSIDVANGYFYWDNDVTGVLEASFMTRYDQVTIEVLRGTTVESANGFSQSDLGDYLANTSNLINTDETVWGDTFEDDENIGEAYLLAFYEGLVDELTVTEPELQDGVDEIGNICPDQGSGVSNKTTPDDAYCYDLVRTLRICQCSGESEGELPSEVEVEVECLPGADGGRHLYKTYTNKVYVDCNETTGSVGDPDYYEKICCYPPPPNMSLPQCKEVTSKNTGGYGLSQETMDYYTSFYDNVEFIPVSPEDGDCGTITVKQNIKSNNCCDIAIPLEYNTDSSIDVIADYSSGFIYVYGGLEALEVKIRGDGFWLDAGHTTRDGVFYNGNPLQLTAIEIFTSDACGGASITITDGCTQVKGSVRSTEGVWVLKETSQTCENSEYISFGHVYGQEGDPNVPNPTAVYYDGDWRYEQSFGRGNTNDPIPCQDPQPPNPPCANVIYLPNIEGPYDYNGGAPEPAIQYASIIRLPDGDCVGYWIYGWTDNSFGNNIRAYQWSCENE